MKGLNILIAEDSQFNQLIFKQILQDESCNFEFAKNGKEALELAVSKQFQIVFMDIEMPILNGFEALEQLRKIPEYKSVPVIACTAHDKMGYLNNLIKTGFDHYITKPFTSEKILYFVNKFQLEYNRKTSTGIKRALFDQNRLIDFTDGDITFHNEITKSLQQNLPQKLSEIKQNLEKKNFQMCIEQLKAIESTGKFFKIEKALQEIAALKKELKSNGPADKIEELFQQLNKVLIDVLIQLN